MLPKYKTHCYRLCQRHSESLKLPFAMKDITSVTSSKEPNFILFYICKPHTGEYIMGNKTSKKMRVSTITVKGKNCNQELYMKEIYILCLYLNWKICECVDVFSITQAMTASIFLTHNQYWGIQWYSIIKVFKSINSSNV